MHQCDVKDDVALIYVGLKNESSNIIFDIWLLTQDTSPGFT